ncbi:MAG TPA: hypothetical protein VHE09_14525 [Rhizomicrobium sp.]|nr:hypothetical protein [Rhizomicrobium sp.]
MSPPPKITRRGMTIGGAVAIGAAIVAGGVFEGRRLFKRRASGRYAEIVNRLDNPEAAALIGKSVEMITPDGITPADEAARDLKARLAMKPLAALIENDLAALESMAESGGWVLPLALAEVCVLAADSV